MGDESFYNLRSIFSTMLDHIQNPRWKSCISEYLAYEMVGAWTKFRCLETRDQIANSRIYTTVFPHAIGAATARNPSKRAAFHGAIPTTTPYGSLTTMAIVPYT
jgi:hypothetical protein